MQVNLAQGSSVLVQESWDHIKPFGGKVVKRFFAKFFEIQPEARSMFVTVNPHLSRQFMATLGLVVASLNRLEMILPLLQQLGRRHLEYGITSADYEACTEAWLFALETTMDDQWNMTFDLAWREVLDQLAVVMIAQADDYSLAR